MFEFRGLIVDFDSRTEVSKRTSDRSTLAEAKIKQWLATKARNEPRERKDDEKPEGGAVSEVITEMEQPTPSASVSKQTTNALAENPNANIKLTTEPNQNIVNCTETAEKACF